MPVSLPQVPPQPEMSPTQRGTLSSSQPRVSRLDGKTVSCRSFDLHQKRGAELLPLHSLHPRFYGAALEETCRGRRAS